jgi:KDO2-lipid IV(A) lauroyltransferase
MGRRFLGRSAVVMLKTVRWFDTDRICNFAGTGLRKIGPWLPEHRVGKANLTRAFPEKSEAEIDEILRGVWDNLGRLGAEFAHLDRLWDFDRNRAKVGRIEVTPECLERYDRLVATGKPVLTFAAHLANWELPAVATAYYGLKGVVLYRRPNIREVDEAITKIRAVNMPELISTTLDAPVRIANALSQGLHAGMLVDQYYDRGVEVTFFGRRTTANPLIARLARQIDCPIHGTRVIRLPGGRFRIDLTDPIEPIRDAEGKVDVEGTMQVITSVVESWVREHPEQWLWLHRRWR